MKRWRPISRPAAWLLLLGALQSGCLNLPREDRAPRRPPDVSSIPDATPREEPRSRYGNPPSYEVFGKTYRVMDSAHGYRERGVASWYGEKFHGRRTSSGEPYDMYAMTAAHKSLPLPTYVQVTNLENRKSVIVKVNDRGPFVHNRIIDLSYTAASRLGILEAGTGLVEVEALTGQLPTEVTIASASHAAPSPEPAEPRQLTTVAQAHPQQAPVDLPMPAAAADAGPDKDQSLIFVQLGAFADPLNAEALLGRLHARGFEAARVTADPVQERMVYRVRIGPLSSPDALAALDARLAAAGISGYHVARE